jgi:CMP-2-keto-3-deoxyoctulosonic acid synthetase
MVLMVGLLISPTRTNGAPESRRTRKVLTAEDHHSGTDREIAAVSNLRVTNHRLKFV